MTYRNQIWKKANSSNEQTCISMLKTIFPSMMYELIDTGTSISKVEVETKEAALRRLKQGLNKITEVEASYYVSILEQKKKPSQIKY